MAFPTDSPTALFTSIYQDRKGYIWFSTREGLSRFDGYSFVNFGERDGLEQQLVNAVTEDKQGRIWVATNGASVALFLDGGQIKSASKFKTFSIVNHERAGDAKPENAVNRVLCDSRNNLWALTDGGLFRASLSDPDLKFEAVKTNPSSESSAAALEDTRGRLWFGYGKEVLEVREGRLINHDPGEWRSSRIIDGKTIEIKKGDLVIVPCGTPHRRSTANKDFTMILIKIYAEPLKKRT